MSVHTTYDELRDKLKLGLDECLELARTMLDSSIWGYDEMRKDYALDLYTAIKKTKDLS